MNNAQYKYAKENEELLNNLVKYYDKNIEDIVTDILEDNKKIKDIRQLSLFESDVTVSKPSFDTDLFTLKPEDFTERDTVESYVLDTKIKEGVDDIFQEFPELAIVTGKQIGRAHV